MDAKAAEVAADAIELHENVPIAGFLFVCDDETKHECLRTHTHIDGKIDS